MIEKMSVYILFQGGGALGMAYLGVWKEVSKLFDILDAYGWLINVVYELKFVFFVVPLCILWFFSTLRVN